MGFFTRCQCGERGVKLSTYVKIASLHLREAYSRGEDDACGIHEQASRMTNLACSVRLNRAEDACRDSPGTTGQDIGGGEAEIIEKIRDAVHRHIEVAEAVIQIQSASGSSATRNVILHLSWRLYRCKVDLRVQARRSDRRRRLHVSHAS